jgi:diacylglycerol O-acyltransferase / wax synthase
MFRRTHADLIAQSLTIADLAGEERGSLRLVHSKQELGGTTAMDAAASLQRYIRAWVRPAAPAPGVNFIATNVPGSRVPLYLAGHRMVDYVGLLPLGGNLGFGVPIISYNQNLYLTMMAEPNLMPDPDRMKLLVEEVFEELKRAAVTQNVPAAVQPGRVRRLKHAGAPAASGNVSSHPGLAALNAN